MFWLSLSPKWHQDLFLFSQRSQLIPSPPACANTLNCCLKLNSCAVILLNYLVFQDPSWFPYIKYPPLCCLTNVEASAHFWALCYSEMSLRPLICFIHLFSWHWASVILRLDNEESQFNDFLDYKCQDVEQVPLYGPPNCNHLWDSDNFVEACKHKRLLNKLPRGFL